jgi:hypothetical protein
MPALINGLTLGNVAECLNIAHDTAFRWQRRLMETQKSIQAGKFNGLVEADQPCLLESGKGK